MGVQWDLKQESFMQNAGFLTNLRLRGSIGTVGNYNIGNYVQTPESPRANGR